MLTLLDYAKKQNIGERTLQKEVDDLRALLKQKNLELRKVKRLRAKMDKVCCLLSHLNQGILSDLEWKETK